MTIPSWYCPFSLDLVSSVQPVVHLIGLDVDTTGNGIHRSIWEVLMSTKEFAPNYVNVPLDHTLPLLPVKKPKRESVESYIPSGIIPSNWTKKHKELIPAVIVLFIDCNWTEANWKDDCATRVKQLKKECAPHGTILLLMLVKCGGEEHLSTEKASALCAAAEIPPKSLYILSHTHPERIQTSVHRLENGMREAVVSYYTSRIRRVRNRLEQATQAPLLVRYNFKLGFFQEIRRDYVSSMSHYDAAINDLVSIRVTDGNVQELKVVASVLNYRQCRIHLLRMEGKEAKAKFDKHIHSFYKMEGNPELMFEHIAWLEQQYHNFGDLLKQYYRKGNTILSDPVTYLIIAAKYAERRAKYAEERIRSHEALSWPSEMEGYQSEVDLKYLGQRPWRGDSFGPETSYIMEDPRGVQTLKYLESISPHSNFIIRHLGIASDFCKALGRHRTRCQLMSMMGEEFLRGKEYERCIKLMTYVLREFGGEKWLKVIYHVAEMGLKASGSDGDIPAYLNFLLILLKKDLDQLVKTERRHVLWSNFRAVLENRIPLAEDGNIQNKEKWKLALTTPVTSYVEVHRECILDAQFSFIQEGVSVHSVALVRVQLLNRHEFPLVVRKVGVRTNLADYNCETDVEFELAPGASRECQLQFIPLHRDIGKLIQIQVGYVDIGKEGCSVLLHYSLIFNTNPTLWNDWPKEKVRLNVIKIEPAKALLQAKIQREEPALVGEWQKIQVVWTNTDEVEVTRILLAFLVGSSDPQHVRLTVDPETETNPSHLSHSMEVEKLSPSESINKILYLKTTNTEDLELKFVAKAKYIDGLGQTMTNEEVQMIETVLPFEVSQWTTDLQGDTLEKICVAEQFILHFQLKNVSKCSLYFKNYGLQLQSRNTEDIGGNGIGERILKAGEAMSFFHILSMISLHVQDPLGQLHLSWKRDGEAGGRMTATEVEVKGLTMDPVIPLYLRAEISDDGRGRLKKPLLVSFMIVNRSTQVYDLLISMESSEYFMNAGPKKLNVKLNGGDHADFSYILFPLKTGLVGGPKLLIEHATTDPSAPQAPPFVRRDVPKTVFITRGEEETC